MNDTYLYPLFLRRGERSGRASSLAGEPQGKHRLPQRHRGRHPSELRRNASGQELYHAGAGGIRHALRADPLRLRGNSGRALVPETELALFYVLVMGYYPVLRVKLNGVKSTLLRWVLKFAVFNAGTVLVYLLLFALLGPAVLDELLADGTGMLAALLAAGNLSFWLCDRALAALTRYYHVILKPKLKKKF
mgnify:CR=1 FL=1